MTANYDAQGLMLAQVQSRSKTIEHTIAITHQQTVEIAEMMIKHERFWCYEYSLALEDLFGDFARNHIWAIIDHARDKDGDLNNEQIL